MREAERKRALIMTRTHQRLALLTSATGLLLAGCGHSPVRPPRVPAAHGPVLVLAPPAPAPIVLAVPRLKKKASSPALPPASPRPRPLTRRKLARRIHKLKPATPVIAVPAPPLDLNTGGSPRQQAAALRAAGHWLWLSQQRLGRLNGAHLSPSQMANRTQAQVYMRQAEQAQRRGDYDRAQNLAYKAWLLLQALP